MENTELDIPRTMARPDVGGLALIAKYLDGGGDPQKIEQLVKLVEWEEERRAKAAFVADFTAARAEMPRVVKCKKGVRGMYAPLEEIQAAVDPVQMKYGFSPSFTTADPPGPGVTRVVCTLFHKGGWSKDYQGDYAIDGKGAKGGDIMNELQGMVSSHTYAQRDMLRLIWFITIAGADKDGERARVIDGEQVGVINDLLVEFDTAGDPVDMRAFLGMFRIESLGDMPSNRFAEAVRQLTRRRLTAKDKRRSK